jgi:hypothetical protein
MWFELKDVDQVLEVGMRSVHQFGSQSLSLPKIYNSCRG